jgi:hypothetical protein
MVKRLLTSAVAAAVVLALVAPMAHASNMGFKLERPLEKPQPESLAIYFVSFPFYRSFQDFGSQSDWQTPDGVITAADVLIDWFTNGDGCCPGDACDNGNNFPDECGQGTSAGAIQIGMMNPDPVANPSQSIQNLSILPAPIGGGLIFSGQDFPIGDPTDPGRADEIIRGYQVEIPFGLYPVIIVGSHNPDVVTWDIGGFDPATGSLNINHFSLPYHTTFTTAEELLEATWDATNEDEQIIISDFDPDTGTNAAQLRMNKSILPAPVGGGFIFSPPAGQNNFALVPGNGYEITIAAAGADMVVQMPLSHY